MKNKTFFTFIVLFFITANAYAHSKFININLGGGGAYPVGKELTSCHGGGSDCNTSYFGAGGGLGIDFSVPKAHLGVGLGATYYFFLRKNDFPNDPTGTSPYQDITILVPQLNFRLLDVIPSYDKKWGTMIIGVAPAIGWLYTEFHAGVKADIAYLYPVFNKDSFTVQIGLGAGFAYIHTFAEGYEDDMYLDFGLRISFGVLREIGAKKKQLGEEEAAMGAQVSEEMKKKDTDGDGLNDYCELMLGTNPKVKDTDGDGLFDSEEDKNRNCVRNEGETDPAVADTDGGGSTDGWEVKNGRNPINPDDDDADQDFVPDSSDACLGTPSGVAVNEKGCPTLIEPTVLTGVTFIEGTENLTPEGLAALDNWVAVLQENPELKFTIVGYTDSKGNKKKLIELSKARAKVVYDTFSSKGISETRMTYEGKGPADPIADNKTEEGRKANNRIVIVPKME